MLLAHHTHRFVPSEHAALAYACMRAESPPLAASRTYEMPSCAAKKEKKTIANVVAQPFSVSIVAGWMGVGA